MHRPCAIRDRQQGGRDRQQGEADQDAESAVDVLAEHGNDQPRDRHAHRAGVDREAHGRRRDAICTGQGRKNGLRREQIDDREERRQSDHHRAQQDARRAGLHLRR